MKSPVSTRVPTKNSKFSTELLALIIYSIIIIIIIIFYCYTTITIMIKHTANQCLDGTIDSSRICGKS